MKRVITDWKAESKRFDEAADIYDLYRPSYPKEIIDKIIEISRINNNGNILEVGAGSGKATELFVSRGYNLTCIEPGENLANKGIERFKETGQVKYIISTLEECNVLNKEYDLAISAQAFHWVSKPLGYKKLYDALKDDGYMALFWNMYLNNGDDFSMELSKISKDYTLLPLFNKNELNDMKNKNINEIKESGYYHEPIVIEIPWEVNENYKDFINFLSTGNTYISLNDELKNELNIELKTLFEKYNNKVTRYYVCTLYIAKKK